MSLSKKKITIKELEAEIQKQDISEFVDIRWGELDFKVKRLLSFEEMLFFIDGVVKTCFNGADLTYMPEIKDFTLKCSILEMYGGFNLPTNIEKKYKIISHSSSLIDVILANIDMDQFSTISKAIDDKIEKQVLSNINTMTKQFNELYGMINNISNQFENIFEGVSKEDVTSLFGSITENTLDPSKIIDIYMKKKKEQV